MAGPGEFTLRALTNGKINLSQAEAIRDLIAAQTTAAAKQASRQIGGELSTALAKFKKGLIKVIVVLESALEFVEDDLPATELTELQNILGSVRQGVSKLAESYGAGDSYKMESRDIVAQMLGVKFKAGERTRSDTPEPRRPLNT